jgi:four helix bundle protein
MRKFEDVQQRVFQFALDVIDLCNHLPQTEANKIIIRQIIRSVTSIGANIEEALGAFTKNDFTYTMNVAKKESRETNYWLRIISESNPISVRNNMKKILLEGEEIVKILSATVRSSRTNRP